MTRFPIIFVLLLVLVGCTTGYRKENDKVIFYSWNEAHGRFEHPVPGADVNTFTVVDDDFAKDKNRVYVYGWPLEGSDGATFQVLGPTRARDKNWEYGGPNNRTNRWKLRPDGFVDGYTKTAGVVVFRLWQGGITPIERFVKGADLNSFDVLSTEYAKDKYHAYFVGLEIEGADPSTFVVVRGHANVPDGVQDKNWYYRGLHHSEAVERSP